MYINSFNSTDQTKALQTVKIQMRWLQPADLLRLCFLPFLFCHYAFEPKAHMVSL